MSGTVRTFPALGTTVHVAVREPGDLDRAHRLAEEILGDVDEVCSRFRADSDLTRVNGRPGEWVEVDSLLVAAVAVACDAARQSDGLVNPLLGRQLTLLGYDRDFDLLVDCAHEISHVADETPAPDAEAWRRILLDPDGGIRIPPGTALDLGATGKAWAADLIGTSYEQELRGSAVVSVGGDLRVAGADDPWPVSVSERPGDPGELVTLDSGGMATSTTRIRRWTRRGARRHHLLDPRTGRPAREVWRTVTATGATCTAANTASTAAVVLGDDAPGWLAARSVTARLVGHDGTIHPVGAWPTSPDRSAA